jgi:hypothetical protein
MAGQRFCGGIKQRAVSCDDDHDLLEIGSASESISEETVLKGV